MAVVQLNISIENLAYCIKQLNDNELHQLSNLLSLNEELLTRKNELESGKVTALSEEEVFNVQL